MTKSSRRRKIASWECVREEIKQIMENVPEHTTSLSLPYGIQSSYNIYHPGPVRIILQPNMNDCDTFVTHHGKAKKFYLNLWTVNRKDSCPEKTQIKQVKVELNYQLKNIIYVPTHRCFVAYGNDLTLRVYGIRNFIEMSRAETGHSVLSLYYNACRDDVLAGCLGFVMIWKFPHGQTDPIFPTQRIECPAIQPEYWVIWIKVDKNSRQLLLNCEEAVVMLDERSYAMKYNFKIDFRHSLPFTACAFYQPSCYFITGSKDYAVKVWNTSMNRCPLVTNFSGHCKKITALEVDVLHHLVISSSIDKTIRLWCLETFVQTYCLETGEEVHHMELMTSCRLFYQSHERIRVWYLNRFHTLFTVLGFEIVTSRRVVSHGFPTRLLLQGDDDAIRIVSPSDGTIITTMFPLETLLENIVDYAYNPREGRLYVVLSSGAILVFNTKTNPCSTYELWKSEVDERVTSVSMAESYGVSCIAMINIDESTEEEDIHYSLLFAGLNNGHISLVYSNELSMHDTIEAHYGKIALLRVSEGLERDAQSSLHSVVLVSCGTDCELKIWKIVYRNYSAKIISLELWSMMKLASIPQDMELIGYTIGLVMDNNTLMTCRVNSEEKRPSRNLQAHLGESVSKCDHLYDIECFVSALEESHLKTITGFSACPTLGLFATSSDDWSVKIWTTEAKLVKEICFEESLRGVCFANSRGDLLVGFQSHISIVPLTNYLPLKILEMLSTMTFPDDVFEDTLPFDRMLSFSYDPHRTPCMPLDLEQRRLLQHDEESVKPAFRIHSTLLLLDNQTEDDILGDDDEAEPTAIRRFSTSQEQEQLDEKLRKFQRSSTSRRSSHLQTPMLEEVIARITQSFCSRTESRTTASDIHVSSVDLVEQLRRMFNADDDINIPDDYWPCAPDGYIPNSVVRRKVPPRELPAHLVPRILRGEELKQWTKKTRRKKWNDDQAPEDYHWQFEGDDLGSSSIFDGYDGSSYNKNEKRTLSHFDSDEEELESSDDENDMKKKWKASKTRDTMLPSLRARQSMLRERKKVSKKPDMPMIIAKEEEVEETDYFTETEERQDVVEDVVETKATEFVHEPDTTHDLTQELPAMLRRVVQQPWFPKTALVDGITVEDIFREMMTMMASCAPLTYGNICEELVTLIGFGGVSDDQQTKMMNLMVDNLDHAAVRIRRASLKTVKELNIVSNKAVQGIVSCLASDNEELQQDALYALEHLLGIKDKEGLRELFISIDVLSRSPSPAAEGPPEGLETSPIKKTDLGMYKDKSKIDKDKFKIDKDKFVQDWLTAEDKRRQQLEAKASVFSAESQNMKMASSIMSTLNLPKKPKHHMSIVDLTFDMDRESSLSSRSCSEEEMEDLRMKHEEEIIMRLRKTIAGCKLLSRLAHNMTPLDLLMNFNVPEEQVEKIEENDKVEMRPPSGVLGIAYRNVHDVSSSISIQSESESEEWEQGRDSTRNGHQTKEQTTSYLGSSLEQGDLCIDGKSFQDINSDSEISRLSKRIDTLTEKGIDEVTPKIFKKMKTYRQNLVPVEPGATAFSNAGGSSAPENLRRILRGPLETRKAFLKVPDFDKELPQDWRTRMPSHPDLPQHSDGQHSSQAEFDELKSPKRLSFAESDRIDFDHREILRDLRRRRLEQQVLAEQYLADREQSLSRSSSLRAPTPSEDNLLSPDSQEISEGTPKHGLPRARMNYQQERILPGKRVVTDDIAMDGTLDGRAKAEIFDDPASGVTPDGIATTVIQDGRDRSAISEYIARDVIADDRATGVTSTDTGMCVISDGTGVLSDDITSVGMSGGRATYVISDNRGKVVISNDMVRTTGVSEDITRVVPRTNIPHSLYTDVAGERLSQGTSVMTRRPLDKHRINNEAMRVKPVNPKLTFDTGCNKWGKSRYGILEVVWTANGIYDAQNYRGSSVGNEEKNQEKLFDKKLSSHLPYPPIAVKKLLKPIRNRNLVTNPYTIGAEQYLAKRRHRVLPKLLRVPEDTPNNSESSSRQQMETERLCTIRELLDVDNFCQFPRSS